MEEVDAIILPILRECGCNVPSFITSIKQLDADLFYHSCVMTLRAINAAQGNTNTIKHPPSMPAGKAARFRITSALSAELEEKGYTGECGYESFLYPNEADMRKLLRWIVEKLPKPEEKEDQQTAATAGTGSSAAEMHKMVTDALAAFSKQPTTTTAQIVSAQRQYQAVRTTALHVPTREVDSLTLQYYQQYQPLLHQQPAPPASFLSSLLEYNAQSLVLSADTDKAFQGESESAASARRQLNVIQGVISAAFKAERRGRSSLTNRRDLQSYALTDADNQTISSAFNRRTLFEQNTEVVAAQVVSEVGTVMSVNVSGQSAAEQEHAEAETATQREEHLAAIQQQLTETQQQIATTEHQIDHYINTSRQMEAELQTLTQSTTALEDAYRIKKRTLDLLPDAKKNEAELAALVKASSTRIVELAQEWETHRQSLLNKLRRARSVLSSRKDTALQKVEQIKQFREEMKKSTEELRHKDLQYQTLSQEYESLPKNINRYLYIRRIMDIMKNISKQKQQIVSILDDLKKLQKDINQLSESSVRSFAIADEIVFQSAKRANAANAAGGGGSGSNSKDASGAGAVDPLSTQAYKCVVELRSGFVGLVACIEEIGRVQTEVRELQVELGDLESRNTSLNTERVDQDLAQVKRENKQLQIKLQGNKA